MIYTLIKNIKPKSQNMNIEVIILSISLSTTKNGTVYRLVVSDSTGKINCALFDPLAALLKESDIILLKKAYAKEFKGTLTLYCPVGRMTRTGEFTMVINEENDMSAVKPVEENGEKSDDIKPSTSDSDNVIKPIKIEPSRIKRPIPIIFKKNIGRYSGVKSSNNKWQRGKEFGGGPSKNFPVAIAGRASGFPRVPVKMRLGHPAHVPFPTNERLFLNDKISHLKHRILMGQKGRFNNFFQP